MPDEEVSNDILPEGEAETLNLVARMRCDMMKVDCCLDMENAERLIPNAREQYRRYGLAALAAYREHRSIDNQPTDMQGFIRDKMAQADGHSDFASAIKIKPELQDVYERYSFATALSIYRYQKNLSPTTMN